MSDALDKSLAGLKASIDGLEKSVENLIAQREACVAALLEAKELFKLGESAGISLSNYCRAEAGRSEDEANEIHKKIDAALALCAGKDKSDAMACQMMRNSEVGE